MEKLILLGIAVWLSFVLTDGFPPQQPSAKPVKKNIEMKKPNRPDYNTPVPVIPKVC